MKLLMFTSQWKERKDPFEPFHDWTSRSCDPLFLSVRQLAGASSR
jgi:hypothetical protein